MTPFDRWQVEAGLSMLSDEELVAGWWQCAACARVNHPGEACRCEPVTADIPVHFKPTSEGVIGFSGSSNPLDWGDPDESDDEVVLVLGREPRATL